MTAYEVGDIVSVEFPFSDLQTRKRRPGLVLLSTDDDLLLARLTTASARESSDVALNKWAEAGLPLPSVVRLTKLATVDGRLVRHVIGHLDPQDARRLAQAWEDLAASIASELSK